MRNQIMKPFQKSLELSLDSGGHFGIGHKLNIIHLIVLSHKYLSSALNQLQNLNLPEIAYLMREIQLQKLLNGRIVENPLQTLKVLIILFFHIPRVHIFKNIRRFLLQKALFYNLVVHMLLFNFNVTSFSDKLADIIEFDGIVMRG